MPIFSYEDRMARALEALVKIEDQKLRAMTNIEAHLIDISDHLEKLASAPIEGELTMFTDEAEDGLYTYIPEEENPISGIRIGDKNIILCDSNLGWSIESVKYNNVIFEDVDKMIVTFVKHSKGVKNGNVPDSEGDAEAVPKDA